TGLVRWRLPQSIALVRVVVVGWPGAGRLVAGRPFSADRRAGVRHPAGHGLAQYPGPVAPVHARGDLQQPPGAEMVHHRSGVRPELRPGAENRRLLAAGHSGDAVHGLSDGLAAGPLAEAGLTPEHPDRG